MTDIKTDHVICVVNAQKFFETYYVEQLEAHIYFGMMCVRKDIFKSTMIHGSKCLI